MTTASRLKSQISANIFLHASSAACRESSPGPDAGGSSLSRSRQVRDGDGDGKSGADDEAVSTTRTRRPQRSRSRSRSKLKLVFFVTGNPGLVAYYHVLLSLVVRDLGLKGHTDVVVAGMSLGGFDVKDTHRSHGGKGTRERKREGGAGGGLDLDPASDSDSGSGSASHSTLHDREEQGLLYPAKFQGPRGRLFTLREQIELSYARVEDLVERIQSERDIVSGDEQDADPVEVVLVGHSVGAYICLELVRLWHERHPLDGPPPQTVSNTSDKQTPRSRSRPLWSPSACILLTPTIQDIHLSPSGLIATPLLTNLPFLPHLAQILVHSVLLRLMPASWFASLVSRVTGMQPGSHGLEATLSFLKSERGVEQALHMASWEMKEIRKNRWGNEVWGASHGETSAVAAQEEKYSSPRLFFWFTKEDHWVADVTREAIMETHAPRAVVQRHHVAEPAERAEIEGTAVQVNGTKNRPRAGNSPTIRILESEGLLHAWCLEQSAIVAKGVGQWLEEVWSAA
ncbi:hypothetical protein PV04_03504 [Phialophora macrospora]|uniref:Uncharacterized protein n=1 Tax=Phialophora macrospora TaxID=1851006 RepID=A0A0D2EAI2_9EURO|nr:hypothetical protein PV04_03504 [Phialophora macrospora]